jgi:hypothetical protein
MIKYLNQDKAAACIENFQRLFQSLCSINPVGRGYEKTTLKSISGDFWQFL